MMENFFKKFKRIDPLETGKVIDKASYDYFDYACRLSTGEIIYFSELKIIDKTWIHLSGINDFSHSVEGESSLKNPTLERGLDVAIKHIVWIADAPHGS